MTPCTASSGAGAGSAAPLSTEHPVDPRGTASPARTIALVCPYSLSRPGRCTGPGGGAGPRPRPTGPPGHRVRPAGCRRRRPAGDPPGDHGHGRSPSRPTARWLRSPSRFPPWCGPCGPCAPVDSTWSTSTSRSRRAFPMGCCWVGGLPPLVATFHRSGPESVLPCPAAPDPSPGPRASPSAARCRRRPATPPSVPWVGTTRSGSTAWRWTGSCTSTRGPGPGRRSCSSVATRSARVSGSCSRPSTAYAG